jgi:hypothetical protein
MLWHGIPTTGPTEGLRSGRHLACRETFGQRHEQWTSNKFWMPSMPK